jgi:hypothetical protein
METKLLWHSKTFWLNALTATLGFLEVTDLSFVPDGYEGYVVVAIGLINVWLRLITKEGVTLQ